MSVLELQDVEVVYERRGSPSIRAVAGASLTVERGQIVGLVGESGCVPRTSPCRGRPRAGICGHGDVRGTQGDAAQPAGAAT